MTDTPTTPDTEAQFEARLREHLQPYLDMLPEADEGEIVPSIMHVVGPVLAERDTHRDRADAHEAMNAELRTEIERLRSQRAALWDLLKRATREARIWCRRANTAIADAVEQTARDMQRAGQLRRERDEARAENEQLRVRLDKAADLHREFKIYEDDCSYSICYQCCTIGTGTQSEDCAAEHHAPCWPCPTHAALTPTTPDQWEQQLHDAANAIPDTATATAELPTTVETNGRCVLRVSPVDPDGDIPLEADTRELGTYPDTWYLAPSAARELAHALLAAAGPEDEEAAVCGDHAEYPEQPPRLTRQLIVALARAWSTATIPTELIDSLIQQGAVRPGLDPIVLPDVPKPGDRVRVTWHSTGDTHESVVDENGYYRGKGAAALHLGKVTVAVIEPAPAADEDDVPLLREAAQAARDYGDSLRADWFDMVADDHNADGCPSDGPCVAVRRARAALADYDLRPADTGKETDR